MSFLTNLMILGLALGTSANTFAEDRKLEYTFTNSGGRLRDHCGLADTVIREHFVRLCGSSSFASGFKCRTLDENRSGLHGSCTRSCETTCRTPENTKVNDILRETAARKRIEKLKRQSPDEFAKVHSELTKLQEKIVNCRDEVRDLVAHFHIEYEKLPWYKQFLFPGTYPASALEKYDFCNILSRRPEHYDFIRGVEILIEECDKELGRCAQSRSDMYQSIEKTGKILNVDWTIKRERGAAEMPRQPTEAKEAR